MIGPDRSTSLTRAALLNMLAVTFAIVAVATFSVFLMVRQERADAVLTGLSRYNANRTERQSQRFDAMAHLHRSASAVLAANYQGLDLQSAARNFDRLFPLQADGTRRSLPGLFDGMAIAPGDNVSGIGSFIGDADDLTADDKRLLLAAFHTVRSMGRGFESVDNFYFFTPRNRLIMFAPDRPDRLMFYREQAPASFNYASEEIVAITRPAANPQRITACTGLHRIMYDPSGTTWTSGCMTPIDLDSRWVGSWGNSLLLDKLVADMADKAVPGTQTILFSREGRVIARSRPTGEKSPSTERYLDAATSRDPHIHAIWAAVRNLPPGRVTLERSSDQYISVERLRGPEWYSVVVYPAALVRADALRTSSFVLYVGFALLIAQMAAVGWILRRSIVNPLVRLTRGADELADYVTHRGPRPNDRGLPLARGDEIGGMARAFARMADLVVAEQRALEAKVAARTLELEARAVTDELTGLRNRRWFIERLEHHLVEVHEEGAQLTVGLIDVDYFKPINDRYGHAVGDEVLVRLSERWSEIAGPSHEVCRIGGEEFAILMAGADLNQTQKAIERLRRATKMPLVVDGIVLEVTISTGLADAAPGETARSLLARADAALYAAKRGGRDRTMVAAESTVQALAA